MIINQHEALKGYILFLMLQIPGKCEKESTVFLTKLDMWRIY